MGDNYPEHIQHFEVVMVKDGVSEEEATVDDFKRVPVTAKDQVQALLSKEVAEVAATGYRPFVATPPNVPTGPEMMARRRALDPNAGKRTFDW